MKKYLAIISIIFFVTASVNAQSKVATDSAKAASDSAQSKEIQDLKDKLATKVDQITKQAKKAVSGVIADISAKSITIQSADDTTYTIKIDDVITKYFLIAGTTKKEIKPSTLSKGDYIIAAGPLAEKTVTANVIYQDEQYIVGTGKITQVNKTDFSLDVVGNDKETVTIDVNNSTKKLLMDSKSLEISVIGFTKIKEGDTIHYVLNKTGNEKVKNRYSGLSLLIIPQEYFMK
jgi:ribosome maturation factor RimP